MTTITLPTSARPMSTTSEPPAAVAPAFSLRNRAMLVFYTKTGWSGARRDAEASREVAQAHGSDEQWGHFYKHLMAKEALQKVKAATQAAYEDHLDRTLPWQGKGSGVRILDCRGLFDYEANQTQGAQNVERALDELVTLWEDHKAEAKAKLNGLYRESDYPSAQKVREKFKVAYRLAPLPDTSDWRIDVGDDVLARLQQNAQDDANAAIREAMRVPVERIVSVVGNMAKRLKEKRETITVVDADGKTKQKRLGVFHDTLVENVRSLASMLPSLNLVDDPRLTALAAQITTDLCAFDADELKANDQLRANVAAKAEQITREADEIAKTMEEFV